MSSQERLPLYEKGQEIYIDVGSPVNPKWLTAVVVDNSPPESSKRLTRLMDGVLRRKPVIVEVGKHGKELLGLSEGELRVYQGSRLRPKGVR